MNVVCITGRITQDLEMTYLPSGTELCKFSIAFNEKYNGVEKTHFFNCTAFKNTAKFIVERAKKGGRIEITGKLSQNTWKTPEGQNRSTVEITVSNAVPIDWADKEDGSQQMQNNLPDDNPFSEKDIPF